MCVPQYPPARQRGVQWDRIIAREHHANAHAPRERPEEEAATGGSWGDRARQGARREMRGGRESGFPSLRGGLCGQARAGRNGIPEGRPGIHFSKQHESPTCKGANQSPGDRVFVAGGKYARAAHGGAFFARPGCDAKSAARMPLGIVCFGTPLFRLGPTADDDAIAKKTT